ncbi:hypothetical protein [Streptomyces sp. XD-27]|uniref:hypothetical protein n=1 Tax=Streptomyces sp. XD-27 TaxID=3062779 RepID=UPI0026F46F29|nr:hypothetical protein [Streptomyces sp. XD-27]WKX70283.1 hypothetical protein Q3Y56_10440 [Streptomyces sp. XD-27]
MTSTPATRFGEVLVVFEGPARIIWHNAGGGTWIPQGLWPRAAHRAELREHLDGHRPVLVILDGAEDTVPLLREEWERAPRALRTVLRSLREVPEPQESPELMEFSLPFLDWLPEPHRERGTAFLTRTKEVFSRVPPALLPPLLLDEEEQPPGGSRIRFARRLLPGALPPGRMAAAVRHVFDACHVSVGQTAMCPAALGASAASATSAGPPAPAAIMPTVTAAPHVTRTGPER